MQAHCKSEKYPLRGLWWLTFLGFRGYGLPFSDGASQRFEDFRLDFAWAWQDGRFRASVFGGPWARSAKRAGVWR